MDNETEKKAISLEESRAEIDRIDREIVALYKKRMQTAADVAAYKKENGLPVLDAERERKLLAKIADLAGEEYRDSATALYTSILSLSRAYQTRLLSQKSEISSLVEAALENTPKVFPAWAVVACQGVEGAYSQMAADRLFTHPDILYFSDFEGVFSAIEKGMCRYGILPVENSTAGSVLKVYDLMKRHRFYIVRSLRLKIDHCLAAKAGAHLDGIREVVSHEQAIRQCSGFLSRHPEIRVTPVANTAEAARMVARSDRNDLAALCSHGATETYGLSVLSEAVQDTGNNSTRFICITKEPEIFPGADRTSFMTTLPHRPGALYHMLSRFYALGVNLTKLESRPIPDRNFEFMFYFDVEASVYSPKLRTLLSDLQNENRDFRYLGTYSETC